jgi:hypothetical protein
MSKVILIEYHDGVPHSVADDDGNLYDFDYCKRYDCLLYEETGTVSVGKPIAVYGPVTYWAAPGVQIAEDSHYGPVKRIKRPFRKYPASRLFDDALSTDYEGRAWCSVCIDWCRGDDLCEHVAYCYSCSQFSTPDEPCEHRGNEVRYGDL